MLQLISSLTHRCYCLGTLCRLIHLWLLYWLVAIPITYAQSIYQEQINLTVNDTPLVAALEKLSQTSGYEFVYDENQLKGQQRVSLTANNQTVARIIEALLSQTTAQDEQVSLHQQGRLVTIRRGLRPKPPVPATVTGRVIDANSKEPLPGATVQVEGTSQGTATDAEGKYSLRIAKPGDYVLVVSYISYNPSRLPITLTEGENKNLDVALQSASTKLGEVRVEARRILDSEQANLLERKHSDVVQDAISRETILKSASITTTQALQRVTGLSISSDGKYAAIRGMSDRDIVAQLNGARLSSANSDRNAVPLDLVPAQLLDAITVSKTVMPDRPGDATAGIIELKTKSVPDSLVIAFTAQTGYNDAIGLGGKSNSFQGAELGFFGQKVKNHRLSNEFQALMQQYAKLGGANSYDYELQTLTQMRSVLKNIRTSPAYYEEAARIDRIQKSIVPILTTARRQVPVHQIYSITAGNRYRLFGKELGVIASLNYYNRYETYTGGENNRYTVYRGNQDGLFGPGSLPPNIDVITPNKQRLLKGLMLDENTGIQTLSYGGLAALTYRLSSSNEVSLHYVGTQGAEATATSLVGTYRANTKDGVNYPVQSYLLRTTGRSFHTLQLRGTHRVLVGRMEQGIRIDWNVSGSRAIQEDPDYRNVTLLTDSVLTTGEGKPTYSFGGNSGRFFRKLSENNRNYTLDATFPFTIGSLPLSLKAGGYYLERNRDYYERNLALEVLSPEWDEYIPGYDLSSLNGDLNQAYGPGGVGLGYNNSNMVEGDVPPVGWLYYATKTENNYTGAKQTVGAFYGMMTAEISQRFKLIGGVRFENTKMNATIDTAGVQGLYFRYGDIKIPSPGGSGDSIAVGMTAERFNRLFVTNYRTTFRALPSVTAILTLSPTMQVRAAYSKTLGRPELGEIIPSNQYNPIQLAFTRGNNRLVNQYSQNFDLRWEWFRQAGEVFSASVFYKEIEGKLERVFSRQGIDQYTARPPYTTVIAMQNNPNIGTVRGVEVEVRKNLGEFTDLLNHFTLGLNVLLAQSRVRLTGLQDSITRQIDRYNDTRYRSLFEQPPYVINASLLYQNRKGTSLNLFYNVVGERLVEVQVDGTPNLYERPFPVLDFTFSQLILKRLTLTGFAKNLLNPKYQTLYTKPGEQGKWGSYGEMYTRRSYYRGREFSLGLSYVF